AKSSRVQWAYVPSSDRKPKQRTPLPRTSEAAPPHTGQRRSPVKRRIFNPSPLPAPESLVLLQQLDDGAEDCEHFVVIALAQAGRARAVADHLQREPANPRQHGADVAVPEAECYGFRRL